MASKARQSIDRHVASLLAMTEWMPKPYRCQSINQPDGREILVGLHATPRTPTINMHAYNLHTFTTFTKLEPP